MPTSPTESVFINDKNTLQRLYEKLKLAGISKMIS